ncbi:PDZ domain-containing protein [Streptomyces sp. NBC_01304]|uniref:PDZ domain-containing protein n=1 Tax=Streptomyces sp. NBC_01304 TaxID=2903818 RepID=UPI002E134920|nr:PDZ domain-containing protein [Streptomyces sp. NBC_01304]
MEQTALRPKSMPGRTTGPGPNGHRPHAARRRGRRLLTVLFSTFVALVLVLAGVGLGTVGATVIGMSKLADLQKQAAQASPGGKPGQQPGPSGKQPGGQGGPSQQEPQGGQGQSAGRGPARATIAVEAVDAGKGAGALLVGVHSPGPGYTAGLVRGDVLLAFGKAKVDSAADLASAVAAAEPGEEVTLAVRHEGGGRQTLTVRPGVVT